jgi:integral membrane sensor domain MASE1
MTASARDQRLRRWLAVGLYILAVAAAYYAGARLGLLLELVRGQVTPLWPPTGIALVALLLLGPRALPGIALGAFLVNVAIGPSLPAVVAIAAGNTLAPACAYLLLRRVGFRIQLNRLTDALALVFLGALGSTLVSATVGSGSLALSGVLSPGAFWATWSVWWTGDAMGVLMVAPLLLVFWTARRSGRLTVGRGLEAAALLASTFGVTLFATSTPFPLLFLVFPFLVWAALRFEEQGATVCALIVSVVTIHAAAVGSGLFAGHDLLTSMVILQAFNGSAALTALLLAAIITERNRAHREVERACAQLADVVAQLGQRATARPGRVLDAVVRPRPRPVREE